MPKVPVLSALKLIKVLKKQGFEHLRTTGSHYIFIRRKDQLRVTVPVHKGHDLGRGLLLSIIKDMELTPNDFLKLLRN